MPKIIVESKNILRSRVARKNIKIYKLRINDERTEDIMPNVKNEIAMDYGKQTIQVYNSFFEKSPKKIIDVNSETQEYKITLHYKIWLVSCSSYYDTVNHYAKHKHSFCSNFNSYDRNCYFDLFWSI